MAAPVSRPAAAAGAAGARRLEGCARRPAPLAPLLSGVRGRRPHAGASPRPAPSVRTLRGVAAGPSPASAAAARRPVEPHRAAVTWRGPGPTSPGGARWGGEWRGCGPGSVLPLVDERMWAGFRLERETGRGQPGPSRWRENRLKQPGTCWQAENPGLAGCGGPGLFAFLVHIFLYFVIRTMCKNA